MLSFALFLLLTSANSVLSRSFTIEAETEVTEAAEAALSFKLIHINDIHAHFEQVNVNTGRCHAEQEY